MTIPAPHHLPLFAGFFHAPLGRDSDRPEACSSRVPAVIRGKMILRHAFRCAFLLSAASALLVACGGSKPEPKATPNDTLPVRTERKSDVAVNAEVGGLNEEATGKVFERAEPKLERCFKQRAAQVEFLAGTVRFFVIINLDQTAKSVTIEESSLGDRDAEKCMQGVLLGMKWPKPVGGRTAHAHYTAAAFEPPDPDVREPVNVDPEEVAKVRKKLQKQASDCRVGSPSPYQVTAYLDTSGKVITASVTSTDPAGELNVDCVVDLVKTAEFPSPGSYAGKVTFEL